MRFSLDISAESRATDLCSPLDRDPNPSSKTLRAPAGVVKDVLENWGQGRPTYDPAKIQASTLIVVGEWDHETTPAQGREVFNRLTKAQDRWFVMIGRATHSMPLERQRDAMHKAVVNFLRD